MSQQRMEARAGDDAPNTVEVGSFDDAGQCVALVPLTTREALVLAEQLIASVNEVLTR